jgi:LmbE family N-acetylglucosaminyl deacetylase
MLKLRLTGNNSTTYKVLCLGSHSDDIEIGSGGTILQLINFHRDIEFYWVVFSANTRRAEEAQQSANAFLENVQKKTVILKNFKESFFPFLGEQIKDFFEQIKGDFSPDIIFTHFRDDLHQDHRQISQLTWNTFRDHLILEYEIPKYDGDIGSPNCFVHLEEPVCQKKIDYILNNFASQKNKLWFDRETFLSLLRLRGVESNSPSKYAEGFYCRKMVLL